MAVPTSQVPHTEDYEAGDMDGKLEEITAMLGAVQTAVGGLVATTADNARKLDDLNVRTRQIYELATSQPTNQNVLTGGPPALVGHPIGNPQKPLPLPPTPYSFEITVRPYKVSSSSEKKWALNTAPVYSCIMRLVSFEQTIPGSMDAVIDILKTCMLGWDQGIMPIDWAALAKDQQREMVARFAQNQQMSFINILRPLTVAGFDMSDPANKIVVTNTQKSLSKNLVCNMPQIGDIKDNLAMLFQAINTTPGIPYRAPMPRTTSKVQLSQTFLGFAWVVRLPPASRAIVSFGDIPKNCTVPRFVFDTPAVAQYPAQPPVAGQLIPLQQQPIGKPIVGNAV